MHRVNFTMPHETYLALRRHCEAAEMGLSTLVRKLIESELQLPKYRRAAEVRMDPVRLDADALAKRDAKMIELRNADHTFRQIGEVIGLTPSGVAKRLKRYTSPR